MPVKYHKTHQGEWSYKCPECWAEMKPQDQIYIDTIKNEINEGRYEHLFETTCHSEKKVFLDIGANIGLVSVYAVPSCKRIVAVEPAPNVFPILLENTKNYRIIECVNVALAREDTDQPFWINDINFTASSTVNTYGTLTTVKGQKLSTILKENNLDHVDVCKIDVEGAEGDSLDYYQIKNAYDIIQTYYVETHNCPNTTWEHKLGTLVGNFARVGYTKMTIDGMAITASK